MQVYCEVYI